MKSTISVFIVLTLFVASLAATPQKVNSDIAKVTVFPGRAQITRAASISLTAGEHQLMFEDLSPTAEDASFHAAIKGTGDITLLGLSHKVVQHLETRQKRVADLETQIRDVEESEREPVNDRQEVFEKQKELLLAISTAGGEQMARELKSSSMDVKNWEAAYGFFGQRLAAVTDSLRSTRQRLEKIDAKLALLKSELQSTQTANGRNSKSVQVDLRLTQAGSIEVELDYVVPNATWAAIYDGRLGANDEVDLSYFAEVTQRTGEDWNDVELTLSTSRPAEGVAPGDVTPWLLTAMDNIRNLPAAQIVTADRDLLRLTELSYNSSIKIDEPIGGRGQSSVLMAQVSEDITALNTVFVIQRRVTIPSGSEAVRAPIDQWTLKGDMRFVSRPRNRAGVYRFSTLTNQEEAPLLPGLVNVFAGSDFLGQTALRELIAQGQSFELPFGLDNNIAVKREIIARKKSVGDDEQSIQETIKITLFNHGKTDRMLTIEEPLPTSNDNRIKVELGSVVPKWQTRDVQGKASWQVTLTPDSATTIQIPYKIEYPQGITISGL
jgi:uncharacterized protein (TIGR02231 family)